MKSVKSEIPKRRQNLLRWNGWGYSDSGFDGDEETIIFLGNRYPLSGVSMKTFRKYVTEKFKVELEDKIQYADILDKAPAPITSPDFMIDINQLQIDYSAEAEDRLLRSHGQNSCEIYKLRTGEFGRIPDLVLWPKSHEQVVSIVELANKHDVVIVPFGGGTNVTQALKLPENENRTICSLDTSQMNHLLWLDKSNLIACFESGIFGQDLERALAEEGYTMGHEPDSMEFSTLGGWVATRASGMKKNTYGNIEDIVISVKMVTSNGVLKRNIMAPRVSAGPDFNHVILGSEGNLGVVTEVVVKIRPLPKTQRYGSLVFPDFESGVQFMREVAKRRCQPTSIRLIDNEQFVLGQTLKPDGNWMTDIADTLKNTFLTSVKKFDLAKIAIATLVFEGTMQQVLIQEKAVYDVAKKFNGFAAGPSNGEKGYRLTFFIAYLRDFALNYGVLCESFETSVAWDKCSQLCQNVKNCIANECKKRKIEHYLMSCRVTQTYDAGACVYFYFGFRFYPHMNPVEIFEEIYDNVMDEILSSGGSISHHHGVGKVRNKWYKQSVTGLGVRLLEAAKKELDPKNVFAIGNLIKQENSSENKQTISKL